MTTISEGTQEGSLPAGPDAAESTAGARARARVSITLPSLTSLKPVTERARSAGRTAAKNAGGKDSMVHRQPPTFHQAWKQQRDAVERYEALLLRWPRLWWAVFHTWVIKPALNFIEWATFSMLRFFVTAIVLFLIVWFI